MGCGVEVPLAVREAGPYTSFENMRVNLSLTVALSGANLASEVPLTGVPPLAVGLPFPLVPEGAFAESGCEVSDLREGGFELAADDGFEVS